MSASDTDKHYSNDAFQVKEVKEEETSNPPPDVQDPVPAPSVSRRRLVFRPLNAPSTRPKNPLDVLADAATSEVEGIHAEGPTTVEGDSVVETGKRNRQLSFWSTEEISVLYEALKLYGRDWDACFRALRKKKISKGKEQMKNFYFNVIKMVRQQTNIDAEDKYRVVPKDARELLMMINAMEWKRKTGNLKYIPENMRQLLLEGSTCVRLKKKKSPLVLLKTPACPSLLKLFSSERKVEKVPAEVYIQLEPLTYGDASHVVSSQRNPYLKVRMSTNDRVSRLFQLLQLKWVDNMKHVAVDIENSVSFCLFPHKKTDVGTVTFAETHPTPAPSLNKLLRDQEELSHLAVKTKQLCNATPSYTVSVPVDCTMVLSRDVISSGMVAQNVEGATVAELYCVCGLQPVIRLVYEVVGAKRLPNPWHAMVELLSRDYGDAIVGRRDDDDVINGPSKKRERTDDDFVTADDGQAHVNNHPHPTIPKSPTKMSPAVIAATATRRSAPKKPAPPLHIPKSQVMEDENAMFIKQMQQVGMQRAKRAATRRRFNQATPQPPQPVFCTLTPSTSVEPPNPVKPVDYTDFSSILMDENSSSTCSMLASLRTPSKQRPPADAPSSVRGKQSGVQRTNHPPSPQRMEDERARHGRESGGVQKDLETLCFGAPLELSPMKSASGFPEDIRPSVEHMVEQMVNQNSVDFFSQFQQLVNHLDSTPEKNKQKQT